MKIFKYKSYEDYKAAQIEANKEKLDWVWVDENVIKLICLFMSYDAQMVLCHGTRNGKEQQLFKKHLINPAVIGTEISETAAQFEDTIQWDFHEEKEEWKNRFDIVYSNSLDHSYKPVDCVNVWRKQLNDTGRLFIEWHPQNLKSNRWDPFAATFEEWQNMFRPTAVLTHRETKILVIKK